MKNIYQIYNENGCTCPFTVRRSNWSKTAFIVQSITGQVSGKLTGKPPYYGNPDVIGQYIDTDTGEIKPDRFNKGGVLPCPGNYSWEML